MKKKIEFDEWIHILAFGVLLLGIFLVIFAPGWFIGSAKSHYYDFTETGNIGSTIGGITAPFIGLTTAALMYLAFYAQFRANKKQWKIIAEERSERLKDERTKLLWKLYEELKEDFTRAKVESIMLQIKEKIETGVLVEDDYLPLLLDLRHIFSEIKFMVLTMLGMDKYRVDPTYLSVFKYKLFNIWYPVDTAFKLLPPSEAKTGMQAEHENIESLLNKFEQVLIKMAKQKQQ